MNIDLTEEEIDLINDYLEPLSLNRYVYTDEFLLLVNNLLFKLKYTKIENARNDNLHS